MIASEDIQKVEKLIKLSDSEPLIPEEFIPWHIEERSEEKFMPDHLVSLEGHALYDQLTALQKRELARYEVAQVMHSYAWSEGLACHFFNSHLLKLSPTSLEYRYLIKETIEEFRHQDMFAKMIRKLDVEPARPSWTHKVLSSMHVRIFPPSILFMSVLAIELVTDVYGKKIRQDDTVFEPLRKVSELHHIEEGRHIHYTKLWLKHYTENAGFVKRTFYGFIVMANILFMRTMYVRKRTFQKIGAKEVALYTRCARENLKKKFGENCLNSAIALVDSFDGFNFITKPLWRTFLNAKV